LSQQFQDQVEHFKFIRRLKKRLGNANPEPKRIKRRIEGREGEGRKRKREEKEMRKDKVMHIKKYKKEERLEKIGKERWKRLVYW
jgi:hypothetical protein